MEAKWSVAFILLVSIVFFFQYIGESGPPPPPFVCETPIECLPGFEVDGGG